MRSKDEEQRGDAGFGSPLLFNGGSAIEAKEKALAAAVAAQDKKGHAVTVIDLEGECSYTDFLVIISANTERQTSAIAEGITEHLREKHGIRPMFREGEGGWLLLDYGDVIVHVFVEDTRHYYDLDRLWPKAPRLAVPASGPEVETQEVEARPTAYARRR
jgi:ribosome-associated protein